MKLNKLRIMVIKGGWSSERAISLKSGAAIEKALFHRGFKISSFDLKSRNSIAGLFRNKFDVAFISLHGKFGEDGTIQAILESYGIPYTGSGVLASALAMNKIFSKKIFQAEGIPTPDYEILHKFKIQNSKFKITLPFPVVVKPSSEGSAIGVNIAENEEELKKAILLAFRYDSSILIEKYIGGREISVGILDERPLPVIELQPKGKFYDYQAKYKVGMCKHTIPALLPKDIYKKAQELALRSHRALGCRDYSRVDMRVEKKDVYVLEVNTIPGMSKLSLVPEAARAAGIDFGELVGRLAGLALKH